MTETNPLAKNIRESSGLQIALLFGLFFVFSIGTSIISLFIEALPFESERTEELISAFFNSVLCFALPAYLAARFSSKQPFKWLRLERRLQLRPLTGVMLVYIMTLPALEWITVWNANIHFPASLAGVETQFREWENMATQTTITVLSTHSILGILSGVIIIGIVTGFSEEIFFRSGFQGILERTQMGRNAAVWISAFIFSSMHFQFFGFIPRLLMGLFFGYLLLWTNDVKIPMFAHILNNSMVVLSALYYESAEEMVSTEPSILSESPVLPMISFIITILFFVFFRGYFFKEPYKETSSWQKSQIPPVTEI